MYNHFAEHTILAKHRWHLQLSRQLIVTILKKPPDCPTDQCWFASHEMGNALGLHSTVFLNNYIFNVGNATSS